MRRRPTSINPKPVDRSAWHVGGSIGILLIHGLGGTPVELRLLTLALASAGYSVAAVQLAGHCSSSADLARSTWRDWLTSVQAAHDRLCQQCATVFVGGLSMGAVLAARLACDRPDHVHGLILLAPALRLDGWSMPWLARFAEYLPHRLIPARMTIQERHPYGLKDARIRGLVAADLHGRDPGRAGSLTTPLKALVSFAQLGRRVRRDLPKLRQPALIMHPRLDDTASLGNALVFQRRLRGPTETITLTNSYHLITLDHERAFVTAQVLRFVARISAPPRTADRVRHAAHAA